MPYKNKTKQLAEGGFYHAYNRGYNKQQIFFDKQDYNTFLYIFKKYLDPDFRETKYLPSGEAVQVRINKPLYDKIELHAYCLMPNHFHLLVKQISKYGMSRLVNVVSSQYSSYFNKKYRREGTIWQGTYKAVLVKSTEQYLHLSRYIHLNPIEIATKNHALKDYQYSSYPVFIGTTDKPIWLKPDDIMYYFESDQNRSEKSYRLFVENHLASEKEQKEKDNESIRSLILDI